MAHVNRWLVGLQGLASVTDPNLDTDPSITVPTPDLPCFDGAGNIVICQGSGEAPQGTGTPGTANNSSGETGTPTPTTNNNGLLMAAGIAAGALILISVVKR